MNPRTLSSIGGALLLMAATASAWDAAGHMLIGEIAFTQMKPEIRAKAAELLKALDVKYNDATPYHMTTAGCWMDDMRAVGKSYPWSKLHYVDIPWTPAADSKDVPEGPSILTGIDEARKTLCDPAAAPEKRGEALGMLIHFIGDIHQPLHSTERNKDRGGNTYFIAGVQFSDLMPRQASNLHTFWDKAFRFSGSDNKILELWRAPKVSERPKAPGEGVIAEEAKKIMATFPCASLKEFGAPTDGLALARESYVMACASAYPAGEPPVDTEVRVLEAGFVNASGELARKQVALAGYRLGAMLNELLAQ